jgi:pyruvate formate lyase activating enzyme
MFCPWCSNPEGLKRNETLSPTPVEEVIKEAENARMIFIDGGGVTFTGGEVSLQKDAVLNAIKDLKSKGISTCIETNASLPDCKELFEEVDYMIADFKSPDAKKLKEICGGDLETIKQNLMFRVKTGKPLLVRIPLIKFFNCGEDNAKAFTDFFKLLQEESKNENLFFEILTYHEFGKDKYEKANMTYTFSDGFVTAEQVSILKEELQKHNLKIIKT